MPDAAGPGLIYDTVGGSGPLTFEQKFSALFSGKITSSTLGLFSTIGLGLGFIVAYLLGTIGAGIAIVVSIVAALGTSIVPTWTAASRPPIHSLSAGG